MTEVHNFKLFGTKASRQKLKEKVVGTKKSRQALKSKLQTIVKKVGGKAADVSFAPLFPFKGLMQNQLKLKGVTPPDNMHELVPMFVQRVVKNSFDDTEQGYYDGSGSTLTYADGVVTENFAVGAAVGLAVTAAPLIKLVLDWIKGLKKKKDEGTVLTQNEQVALGTAEQIASDPTIKAELQADANANPFMAFIMSPTGMILCGLVIGGVIYFATKKKG